MCNGLSLIILMFSSKCETRAKLSVAVIVVFHKIYAGIRVVHKCAPSKLSLSEATH